MVSFPFTTNRNRVVGLLIVAAMVLASIAVAVAVRAASSSTPVVMVATGENFPDAFGAGPVAALHGGPVLLVRQNSIPGPTASELTRLKPDRIVIVGGPTAISAAVEADLAAYAPKVDRIGGTDRYATAAGISSAFFPATIGGIPPLPDCGEDEGIVKQGGVWVCADLAPPPPPDSTGTVREVEWEVWDFSSDPNLLGNDDKCGFTQLLDLTGDGRVEHMAIAAPAGEPGGFREYRSVFMLSGETGPLCREACTSDPQCAAAVFTEHNPASGEGVCHFTRHVNEDVNFSKYCNSPTLCATTLSTRQPIFKPWTKCDANNP